MKYHDPIKATFNYSAGSINNALGISEKYTENSTPKYTEYYGSGIEPPGNYKMLMPDGNGIEPAGNYTMLMPEYEYEEKSFVKDKSCDIMEIERASSYISYLVDQLSVVKDKLEKAEQKIDTLLKLDNSEEKIKILSRIESSEEKINTLIHTNREDWVDKIEAYLISRGNEKISTNEVLENSIK